MPTKTDSPFLKSVAPKDGLLLGDCAIITWRGGGGVGKLEGGIGENDNNREGGSKIYYIRGGGITFSFLLQTGKVVEEILEFKYKY